jgi:hypothetical protein
MYYTNKKSYIANIGELFRIMEKMPEKVGHPTNRDERFWADLKECVWGSETGQEFEIRWNGIMTTYGLHGNEWLTNRYQIRESWILAYFMRFHLLIF